MKRLLVLSAMTALVLFAGAGCSWFNSEEPGMTPERIPGAIDDPKGANKGNFTDLSSGPAAADLVGQQGKWVSNADDSLGAADKDGWTKADPTGNRLGMPVIYFPYDSDMLVPSESAKLDKIAEYLSGKDQLALVIEGHCDQRGTEEYNRALGERRANIIREYLAGKGLADKRMKTISYGKDKPAVEGSGENIWKQNRRGVPEPMIMPGK